MWHAFSVKYEQLQPHIFLKCCAQHIAGWLQWSIGVHCFFNLTSPSATETSNIFKRSDHFLFKKDSNAFGELSPALEYIHFFQHEHLKVELRRQWQQVWPTHCPTPQPVGLAAFSAALDDGIDKMLELCTVDTVLRISGDTGGWRGSEGSGNFRMGLRPQDASCCRPFCVGGNWIVISIDS